jgi:hypothetical protein
VELKPCSFKFNKKLGSCRVSRRSWEAEFEYYYYKVNNDIMNIHICRLKTVSQAPCGWACCIKVVSIENMDVDQEGEQKG